MPFLGDTMLLLTSAIKIVFEVLAATVRGVSEHKELGITYKSYVLCRIMRGAIANIDVKFLQSVTTTKNYGTFTKKKHLKPSSVQLNDDPTTYCHWLGDANAKNVLLWFHGGGYVNAASDAHYALLWNQVLAAKQTGVDLSVLVLAYGLAPHAKFPRQLQQANSALKYLLSDQGRNPETITIGGDSAGAHLALSLVSHLLHPHPSVTPLSLPKENFAGLLLVSPWVTFQQDSTSWKSNERKDLLDRETLKLWSGYFIGDAPTDEYSNPISAPSSWWKSMPFLKIAVTAGADEVFVDDIVQLTETLKTAHPSVQVMVAQGEPHDAPLIDYLFKTASGASTAFMTEFILDGCRTSQS